ncbi:cytochrome P450 [Nocardia terpenica]
MSDQILTFFLAGTDTAASALAWSLYFVSCNPDVAQGIRWLPSTSRHSSHVFQLYPASLRGPYPGAGPFRPDRRDSYNPDCPPRTRKSPSGSVRANASAIDSR